jgi:hypothetical protein
MSNYHQLCTSEITDPNKVVVEAGDCIGEPRFCLSLLTQHIQADVPEHIREEGWVSLNEAAAQQLLVHLSWLLDPSRTRTK